MNRDLRAPYLGMQGQPRARRCSQTQKLKRNLAECHQSLTALKRVLRRKNRELHVARKSLQGRQSSASLETLAAGIAHDLKNPLNFVNSFAAISVEHFRELRTILAGQRQRLDPGIYASVDNLVADLEENAQAIDENGKRANKIVEHMVNLAHGRGDEPLATDLNHLVRTYAHLAFKGFRIKHPQIDFRPEERYEEDLPRVPVLPHSLGRVLINLINNGLEALLEKKRLVGEDFVPRLRIGTQSRGDRVMISVWDNGIGISREKLGRVFEPFFSTKRGPGENLGMGLSICRDIVMREHGGQLHAVSEEGRFTELRVYLPRTPIEASGLAMESGGAERGFPQAEAQKP